MGGRVHGRPSDSRSGATKDQPIPSMTGKRTARGIAFILGLILLFAGMMKAHDLPLFVRQIKAYGVIPYDPVLPFVAWGVVASQFALGSALMVFYRPRLFLGAAAAFFAGLAGLATWAWVTGATDSCGCYGTLMEQSPRTAAFENLLFLILALSGPALLRAHPEVRSRARGWAVAAASLAGVILPLVIGLPPLGTTGIPNGPTESRIWTWKKAQEEGPNTGALLVVLLSLGCQECLEALHQLDTLAASQGLPPLVGLIHGEEDQVERFREEFQPAFRIETIPEKDYWRLLGTGDTPRVILDKEGRPLRTWDRTVPAPDAIQSLIRGDARHRDNGVGRRLS